MVGSCHPWADGADIPVYEDTTEEGPGPVGPGGECPSGTHSYFGVCVETETSGDSGCAASPVPIEGAPLVLVAFLLGLAAWRRVRTRPVL